MHGLWTCVREKETLRIHWEKLKMLRYLTVAVLWILAGLLSLFVTFVLPGGGFESPSAAEAVFFIMSLVCLGFGVVIGISILNRSLANVHKLTLNTY